MAGRGCADGRDEGGGVEAPPRVLVLSYNILCRSLGSNCIPWVMTVSAAFREAVERATGRPFLAWKQAEVAPEYVRHFHKNMASGDYTAMRRFWGARACRSQADVPRSMTGATFHAEDQLAYVDPKSGEKVVASTLRGVLRAKLPEGGLGLSLFEHLLEEEEQVYDWEAARGARVFREITRPRQLLPAAPRRGGAPPAEGTEPSSATWEEAPDVVLLQEYDVAAAEADYRGTGRRETFSAAMAAEGYAQVLFKDPLRGREPAQGHGVFWRSGRFELDGLAGGLGLAAQLECGDDALGEAARNVDLAEHWHLRAAAGGGPGEREALGSEDRRNLALLRLRHRASGRPLWVLACHLMTTSRDCARTNEFPGEVRAGELRTIREEVARCVPAGEALLLAGDFNTDVRELHSFAAPLPGSGEGRSLRVETGLAAEEGASPGGLVLRWQAAGGEPLTLREAFAGVHRWGAGVGPRGDGGHCTSVNASRLEWIDYLWYAESLLTPLATSDARTPENGIPDRQHGSDHLPIAVLFELSR